MSKNVTIAADYSEYFREGDFSRLDEREDHIYYGQDRFVGHLDSLALSTVESIIGQLIVEERPVILDLMASWDSHLPEAVNPAKTVGLGLNENELHKNEALSERIVHDLNKNPVLPFPDNSFDVVLNIVSIDYLTKPVDVFVEVGRVLKPGGLHLVIFSNRFFPEKVVKVWRESGEEERIIMVQKLFDMVEAFEGPRVFLSKGRPRPKTDKYAHLPIPATPFMRCMPRKKEGVALNAQFHRRLIMENSLPKKN